MSKKDKFRDGYYDYNNDKSFHPLTKAVLNDIFRGDRYEEEWFYDVGRYPKDEFFVKLINRIAFHYEVEDGILEEIIEEIKNAE